MPAPPLRSLFPWRSSDGSRGESTIQELFDGVLGKGSGIAPVHDPVIGWTGSNPSAPLAQWAALAGYAYTFLFNVSGTISVANDVSPHVQSPGTFVPLYLTGTCLTNPTGADVHVKFRYSSDNGQTFTQDTTTFTVCLASTGGDAISISSGTWCSGLAAMRTGIIYGLDVTQVGSSVAGANLQVGVTGLLTFDPTYIPVV